MTYEDKSHRNDRQIKIRLDEDAFSEFKEFSHEHHEQHSVMARELILALLDFKREHGFIPFPIKSKHRA